jgi:hypothetical protein
MYSLVLEHARTGDWLFLEYEQAFTTEGVGRLAAHLDAAVDASFPEEELRRSRPTRAAPAEPLALYKELRRRTDA